jgi:hypothetical protein
MKATDFEYRHQLLLHELIVGAAVLTYLVDRDNIIWRFVKTNPTDARLRERAFFAVATLLFGVSAWLCTRARAHHSPLQLRYLGEYFYAFALASLVPLAGSLVLIIGEGVRILRLFRRNAESPGLENSGSSTSSTTLASTVSAPLDTVRAPRAEWSTALRREAIKWGLFVAMVVFTTTLRDRIAEILICATIVIWVLLTLKLSTICSGLRRCVADRRA